MKTSYFSFILFYLMILIAPILLYSQYQHFGLSPFSLGINALGSLIAIWFMSRIKYIRKEKDVIKVTSPIGGTQIISKQDIKGVGRVFSNLCWLSFNDGKFVLFTQRATDTIFSNRDLKLKAFYAELMS